MTRRAGKALWSSTLRIRSSTLRGLGLGLAVDAESLRSSCGNSTFFFGEQKKMRPEKTSQSIFLELGYVSGHKAPRVGAKLQVLGDVPELEGCSLVQRGGTPRVALSRYGTEPRVSPLIVYDFCYSYPSFFGSNFGLVPVVCFLFECLCSLLNTINYGWKATGASRVALPRRTPC